MKKKLQKTLKKNHEIKFSCFQQFKLFCMKVCSCFWGTPREEQMWRLYEDGVERIGKEFDVIKVIKTVRNAKLAISNYLRRTQSLKWKLKTQAKTWLTSTTQTTTRATPVAHLVTMSRRHSSNTLAETNHSICCRSIMKDTILRWKWVN